MVTKKQVVEDNVPVLGRPGNHVKMGIVGMPNVGKSTLFNNLSKLNVPASNYSFCTIDPNVAKVPVPDERFDLLCSIFKSPSQVQATLTITDIAGLVRGANEGNGLGNAFLSHISAVDAIYHVCRAFTDKDIEHYEGSVDPVRDLQTISTELVLKDKQQISKEIENLKKIVKAGRDKNKKFDLEVAEKVMEILEQGKDVRSGTWQGKEIDVLNKWLLLTAKPVIYLVNISKKDFCRQKNKFIKDIKAWVAERTPGAAVVPFSATFENEASALETEEERQAYCMENKAKSMLDRIIHLGYKGLGLVHYFTCGPDEVKCWTIRAATKAKPAAGVIHSDLEQGFICAEVMAYDDFKEHKSEAECRKAGKYRTEGKEYVVKDGDIIYFKSGLGKKKK